MESIQTSLSRQKKNNFDLELKKAYSTASKNEDFKKLISSLKVKDNIAYKYTSKLETTVLELNNCLHCRSLLECKNKITGYVYYPKLVEDNLEFNYQACRYKLAALQEEKVNAQYYEMPYLIKQARMKDIDLKDKTRLETIKWLKNFYDNYDLNRKQKGLYLHGSFGSGKTFLVAALLNELAVKGASVVIVYFPDFLLSLKAFNDDYIDRINELKKCNLLLLDDLGAQTNSVWSRDEVLGSILQYRMDNQLPTFITSNYSLEDLEIKLSTSKGQEEKIAARRIVERIKQLTDSLTMVSANRRK